MPIQAPIIDDISSDDSDGSTDQTNTTIDYINNAEELINNAERDRLEYYQGLSNENNGNAATNTDKAVNSITLATNTATATPSPASRPSALGSIERLRNGVNNVKDALSRATPKRSNFLGSFFKEDKDEDEVRRSQRVRQLNEAK